MRRGGGRGGDGSARVTHEQRGRAENAQDSRCFPVGGANQLQTVPTGHATSHAALMRSEARPTEKRGTETRVGYHWKAAGTVPGCEKTNSVSAPARFETDSSSAHEMLRGQIRAAFWEAGFPPSARLSFPRRGVHTCRPVQTSCEMFKNGGRVAHSPSPMYIPRESRNLERDQRSGEDGHGMRSIHSRVLGSSARAVSPPTT